MPHRGGPQSGPSGRELTANKKCEGRSRTKDAPCGKWAEPGRKFCKFHGGRVGVGPDNPNFKHGRYSRYLPARMLDKYHESLADPDILNLRDQIAVTDARLAELYTGLDRGESGHWWRRLTQTHRLLQRAQRNDDPASQRRYFNEMEHLIKEGSDLSRTWDDIVELQDHRRRMVNTERKRLEAIQGSIPASRAVAFAMAVVAVIRKHVTDKLVLQAVQRDIAALLSRRESDMAEVQGLPGGNGHERRDEYDPDDDDGD